jgi:phosphoribosylformimino-5-aminoimidazole carboxamide ribotide isomerase
LAATSSWASTPKTARSPPTAGASSPATKWWTWPSKFEDWGVESIIYTDIGRDGMLSGINVEATVRLAQALSIPVIASGGLSNMTDIEQLCAVESEGVEGVICGRAIYSGDLDFAVAQRRADELNG